MGQVKKKINWARVLLLLVYMAIVLYFVLLSDRLGRTAGYETYHYNLVPFDEITRFVKYRDQLSAGAFALNMIGNVLVTIPFGILLPFLRTKKTGLVRITIDTFLLSLCIETLQLVTKVGVFDVDDLILNTLGGLVGCLLYKGVRDLYIRYKRKDKK